MWDLWWTKWQWGRFSQNTSVSITNSHSTDCSKVIIFIIIIIIIITNLSSGAGIIGQIVADVPSVLSLTQLQEKEKDDLQHSLLWLNSLISRHTILKIHIFTIQIVNQIMPDNTVTSSWVLRIPFSA
jgi:hypothetical protein